jgi:two-component system, NarL family, invasion response regulator UvrY
MMRVIICDDHPIVREGVRMIIQQSHDIQLEGEASNGYELLAMLKEHSCDVLVMDISFPEGPDGLDLLKGIQEDYPKIHVLVMSMHPEEQIGVRALKAGASGYLVKGSVPSELVNAIRKVATGGKYVSPTLAEQLATELAGKRGKPPHEKLSDREFKVLCLLASGKGQTEIAHELFLSPATVGTYRSRILTKLELRNTAELIRYAVTHNLIP